MSCTLWVMNSDMVNTAMVQLCEDTLQTHVKT